MSYNRSILVGRITKELELKQTPNGVSVTSFSIAVDRQYKSKSGEKQTDFIGIVAFRQTAEFITKYFNRGSTILIEGTLQSRTYTAKDGQKRTAWEVVADQARFVGSKSDGQGANTSSNPLFSNASPSGADDFAEIDDDGDLPF